MKGSRYQARRDALQILYQLDFNQGLTPEAALYHFENHFSENSEVIQDFTQRLVTGVSQHLHELDSIVQGTSENWRPERMTVVDRNILRLGVFELHHCDDIPATVTLNEMIELAKQFGSENSAAFINGILDRVKAVLNRPSKAP